MELVSVGSGAEQNEGSGRIRAGVEGFSGQCRASAHRNPGDRRARKRSKVVSSEAMQPTTSTSQTTPYGLHVNVFRPTVDVAPLSNKQVEDYLASQPKPDDPAEKWVERSWELVHTAVNNAEKLKGLTTRTTLDALKEILNNKYLAELHQIVFQISGLLTATDKADTAAGEAPAAPSNGGVSSAASAAA